jgi:hypothetical protein
LDEKMERVIIKKRGITFYDTPLKSKQLDQQSILHRKNTHLPMKECINEILLFLFCFTFAKIGGLCLFINDRGQKKR